MQKDILYFTSLTILFIGQIFNVIGSFISVPYTTITFWEAYKMSIPYAFIQRMLCTLAIYYINNEHFFTNNQLVFIMLIMQFCITLVINSIYLKNKTSFS